MQRSETTVADPGEIEVDYTRYDALVRFLDQWIYAPLGIILSDWRGRIGLGLLIIYLFMGTLGTVIIPEPEYLQADRAIQPFEIWEPLYILGTSVRGESLLAMIVHSTPAMLIMVGAGAVFATSLAIIVGVTAGFKGGFLDSALMTVTDIVMTLPGLPLVIILAAVIDVTNPAVMGILLSINGWAGLARELRSQVLSIRRDLHVEASRCMGLSTPTIISYDMLPKLMPYVGINFMNSSRGIIFGAVGLYFLGILPFAQDNWGTLLDRAYQSGAIWTGEAYLFLVPLITILLFSLALILLAQSMDRIFNPRIRARHSRTVKGGGDEGEEVGRVATPQQTVQ